MSGLALGCPKGTMAGAMASGWLIVLHHTSGFALGGPKGAMASIRVITGRDTFGLSLCFCRRSKGGPRSKGEMDSRCFVMQYPTGSDLY